MLKIVRNKWVKLDSHREEMVKMYFKKRNRYKAMRNWKVKTNGKVTQENIHQ